MLFEVCSRNRYLIGFLGHALSAAASTHRSEYGYLTATIFMAIRRPRSLIAASLAGLLATGAHAQLDGYGYVRFRLKLFWRTLLF